MKGRGKIVKNKDWEVKIFNDVVFLNKGTQRYFVGHNRMTGYDCMEPGIFETNILTGQTEDIEKKEDN